MSCSYLRVCAMKGLKFQKWTSLRYHYCEICPSELFLMQPQCLSTTRNQNPDVVGLWWECSLWASVGVS